ncbi:TerB family tellurite resistance protein [Corynebacterium kozikiae]|uniref:TerB family tellurite resistance protein n=1 Tax=Corynebacterium kozikiae TaxID=2968469 RepID=UPI00211C1118|nr:TerB family tellurite resistance protein [Corynebacterium sp. 76QC2CO]MCQ9343996.1 TerB family tellurite resistance protein [Corynebacterium sp. 76QC2CO]
MDFKLKGETKEHSEQDKNFVKKELDQIRGFVGDLSIEDLKQGDWFVKLLAFSLDQYVNTVDAEYFKQKYPNLPPDAVVDARIKMASNYASIEGAITSTAYSGAIAATIGSGGGASPLTLPAGGASFAIDLVYTSYLQLRMTYDISVLYGVPINIKDPDDTWKLVKLAFGIKAGETINRGAMKSIPAFVRPLIKKIFSGSTLTAAKSLPVIGKHLLQRNIIKFAIPAVTIPVTTAMNWWLTKLAGDRAKQLLRREAKIIESTGRIIDETEDFELLMSILWLLINVDEAVLDEERLFLHHLTLCAEQEDKATPETMEFLEKFRSQIEIDEDAVWDKVDTVSADAAPKLFKVAVIASAVDGKMSKKELDFLERLADRLRVPFDKKLIDDMKRKWQ